jgi:single-stranded-DNA-specific exonuclease
MLLATNGLEALEKAELLDALNKQRRAEQDEIHELATKQAETYKGDPVLVVSHPDWNHGIVGIVAAKLLEKYKKPAFVLQEMGSESKGSARSYGGFSAADAIRAADRLITKGGGHKLAAGVTLPTKNIEAFRKHLNDYFRSLQLPPQPPLLLPSEDVVTADFAQLNEGLLHEISQLEPFGNGNPEPIVKIDAVQVVSIRRMGNDGQHLKLSLQDYLGGGLDVVAFSADESWFVEPGEVVSVWIQPLLNEWRGVKRVEGRLVRLEMGKDSGEE